MLPCLVKSTVIRGEDPGLVSSTQTGKFESQSLIPRTHRVEGKDWFLKRFSHSYVYCGTCTHTCVCTQAHTTLTLNEYNLKMTLNEKS